MAFGLWLACLFGLAGIHRFYLGRPVTGVIWLFTWGLLGIGQLVDLVRLRDMVEDQNILSEGRRQRALDRAERKALPPAPARDPVEDLRQALLKAAASRGGSISVTQGVLATGKSFEEVEEALDAMAKKGYADIDNDPRSGVVVYKFGDLA
ncbi:MAG TPA: TM2 domain-containing protein [Kofleriaceae bacterium]|nr:TM2 domain-containing protein [Kofleriaceae bacterium]